MFGSFSLDCGVLQCLRTDCVTKLDRCGIATYSGATMRSMKSTISKQVFFERRKSRGQSRRESLVFQLRAAAKQLQAEAIVLADASGRVVARSRKLEGEGDLAQFGACFSGAKPWFGHMDVHGACHSVAVSPMRLEDGQMAYLCVVGADRRTIGGTMLQTAAGVRRIMKIDCGC